MTPVGRFVSDTQHGIGAGPLSSPLRPPRHTTRYARGRLLLWIILSVPAVVIEPRLLTAIPGWVAACWVGWIAASAVLLAILEFRVPLERRPWLDALQAMIDMPVIGLVTWHAGAGPHLMAILIALPMVSSSGWLPRREAIWICVVAELVIIASIAALLDDPEAARRHNIPSVTFGTMVFAIAGGTLAALAYFQFEAVRLAGKQRERWERLFDSAPDSIFVLDRNASVVRMNAAAERISGYAVEELGGTRLSRFTVPEDRERTMALMNRTLAGEPTSYESRAIRKDGSVASVHLSNAPLVEYGEVVGVLTIVHDLTDVRRAEGERARMAEALESNRRLLQSIIATMPTYLYVLDLPARRVAWANDGLVTLLGAGIGSLNQSAGATRRWFHPDDLPIIRRALLRLLRSPEDAVVGIEYRLRAADGGWRWMSDRLAVFERDAEGRVTKVLGSAADITTSRETRDQLRTSEQLYRRLIENIPGGVVTLYDDQLRVRLTDGTGLRALGMQGRDFAGQDICSRLVPDEAVRARPFFQRALDGESVTFEVRYDDRILEVRAVPLDDPTSARRTAIALARDVTEQRRLEADLRQTQKLEAVGTLAGGVAHDFNNILASIIGYAELALLDAAETGVQGDLQQVLTAAARGRQLVQRILAFSRISTEELQPVDVGAIVDETLRLLRPTLPPGVTVEYTPDEGLPPVLGDPSQVHQVLLNICTNAVYAMREHGGQLRVALDRQAHLGESTVRLRVRDTGTGMPVEVQDRAFDPFFTTKPPGEGSGMGLAVAHGIITSMGGTVTLDSSPGHGTLVTIEWPAEFGRPSPTTHLEAVALAPQGHESVLVVDDDAGVGGFVRDALLRLGYQVTVVSSGEAAISLLVDRHQPFDLVISDVTMPGMSGEDVLLASRRLRPDTQVLLITGFSARMTAERAATLGAAGLLTKPLTVEQLGTAVRRALDSRATAPA